MPPINRDIYPFCRYKFKYLIYFSKDLAKIPYNKNKPVTHLLVIG